jgi:hypothetical protein
MLATTKAVRSIMRNLGYKFTYNSWGAATWTDVRKAKTAAANERYVVFKFYDKAEADNAAKQLQTILTLAGFVAKVKRTTSVGDAFMRSNGGEYVRVIAQL